MLRRIALQLITNKACVHNKPFDIHPVCADVLSHYFGAKLSQLSQAALKSSSDSGSGADVEEEGRAEAMDMGGSPKSAKALMGEEWGSQLQHVLSHLQQLGLQVEPLVVVLGLTP